MMPPASVLQEEFQQSVRGRTGSRRRVQSARELLGLVVALRAEERLQESPCGEEKDRRKKQVIRSIITEWGSSGASLPAAAGGAGAAGAGLAGGSGGHLWKAKLNK